MYFLKNASFKIIFYTAIIICVYTIKAGCFQNNSPQTPERTIVLDPGHGGSDTGAKGADSSLEKDITLLFAKKIKDKLDKKYNVILTRNGDYWIGDRQRAEIANNSKAELFISIHTGASFLRETNGLSLIYFTPSGDSTAVSEENRNYWYQTQKKYIPLSRLFTKGLSKRLSKNPNLLSPRVNSLPVSLLAGINMPAILIELGYLTNPSEEKQLKNHGYTSDYIEEIYNEVEIFLTNHPSI